jgi:uncharacterized Zn finger protein
MNPIEILQLLNTKMPTNLKQHFKNMGVELSDIDDITLALEEGYKDKFNICFIMSNSYDAHDIYYMDFEEIEKYLKN